MRLESVLLIALWQGCVGAFSHPYIKFENNVGESKNLYLRILLTFACCVDRLMRSKIPISLHVNKCIISIILSEFLESPVKVMN